MHLTKKEEENLKKLQEALDHIMTNERELFNRFLEIIEKRGLTFAEALKIEIRKYVANHIVDLYKNKNFSIGKIAKHLERKEEDIINTLADNGVYCYDYSDKELKRDLNNLEKNLNQ